MRKNVFASNSGIIAAGAVLGVMAVLLQHWGNPGNMGICIVCFNRDIAGALGLHRAEVVQYLRPEIMGLILGAWAASLIFGEFKARGGSSPLTRFVLGIVAALGALVFLGCPWRAILRLAGGDGNAILGMLGLIAGIGVGTLFFRQGYSLGRNNALPKAAGYVMPAIALLLILLYLLFPPIAGEAKSGVLFYSLKGPGSQYAPFLISLGLGLLGGFIAQRSRFCTMGAIRDVILFKHWRLFLGFCTMLLAAWLMNMIFGTFKPGFEGQPIAHTQGLWNFMGMLTAGLAFALAGGCPGRQLFMAGEGDHDAGVFVLGLLVGVAMAHNMGMASSGAGIGSNGAWAALGGLAVCLIIGFANLKKGAA